MRKDKLTAVLAWIRGHGFECKPAGRSILIRVAKPDYSPWIPVDSHAEARALLSRALGRALPY